MHIWFVGICTLFLVRNVRCGITCKDQKGQPVDWFIMAKLPKLRHDSDPNIEGGVGYYYMDVNSMKWTLGVNPLNETNQAVAYTLQQIYKNKAERNEDVFYAMYNDEGPDGKKADSRGHTKGDISFDTESGFWLVHSVPKYPTSDHYEYAESGKRYGQSFLCVSYSYKYLDPIGKQLFFNYPYVYAHNIPKEIEQDNPYLAKMLADKHPESEPWTNMEDLVSIGGQKFKSFAKFTKFDKDLYDAWVAPYFKSPLLVESWQNGRGKLPSNCSAEFKVENVQMLDVGETPYKETEDHSKWAITNKKSVYWTCIGGINRQHGQADRAGGTVCFDIPAVWKAFSGMITQVEECK